jgi:hypothetical protein
MSPQTIPLNDAAVAMLGMCDNDCGRPAVSGFGRGLYKHCSRACERANVVTFDRETVLQLRQESDAAMTVAAKKSNPDEVAAIEAAEAAARDRVRTKIGKKSTLAPVVTPTQKPAPAPIAAPIQVADVVAVVPEPEPVREPVVAKEPKPRKGRTLPPQCLPRPFVLRPDADDHPELCRRDECTREPAFRGLCGPCHTVALGREILESFALPVKPHSERKRGLPEDLRITPESRRKDGICKIEGCGAPVASRGLCDRDRRHAKEGGYLEKIADSPISHRSRSNIYGDPVPTQLLALVKESPGLLANEYAASIGCPVDTVRASALKLRREKLLDEPTEKATAKSRYYLFGTNAPKQPNVCDVGMIVEGRTGLFRVLEINGNRIHCQPLPDVGDPPKWIERSKLRAPRPLPKIGDVVKGEGERLYEVVSTESGRVQCKLLDEKGMPAKYAKKLVSLASVKVKIVRSATKG